MFCSWNQFYGAYSVDINYVMFLLSIAFSPQKRIVWQVASKVSKQCTVFSLGYYLTY